MQANLSRRFFTIAAAILATTVVPWMVWGRLVEPPPGKKAEPYELRFGLDLRGGASITYRVQAPEGFNQADVLAEAIRITRRRVDSYGLAEVNIAESGLDQFTVELPGRGKEEIDRIKKIMGSTGALEFRIVATPEKVAAERGRREREGESYVATPGFRWVPGGGGDDGQGEYLLETPEEVSRAALAAAEAALAEAEGKKPAAEIEALRARVAEARSAHEADRARWVFRGEDIARASAERNQQGLGYVVAFEMKAGRKAAFGDFTGDHIRRQMAIVLNNVVETAPEIKSKLPGSGQISSDFDPYTLERASDLVTVLQSGALAAAPREISSFVVGPGLGEDAVRRGSIAVAISFVLVVLCMAYYYRGVGWVANLALVLNLVMTLGVLMFMNAALSLPGIAGFILTLGMAVDANILVNERVREEKAAGKGLLQAITAGYDRAWITILDSNLTTVLAAMVLYAVGTGPIRGFALTLIIGLATSMFTACYVTRTVFLWALERGILREFRMTPVMVLPEIRFTAARGRTMGVSAVLIVLGVVAFTARSRHAKYDLEFNGGERIVVALRKPVTIDAMRDRVEGVVRPAFERAAAAAGEPATLGPVSVRTVRARGADAAELDLATESDRFEFTAQVVSTAERRSEALGRVFAEEVVAALREDLLPSGIEGLVLEGEAGKPGRPFRGLLHVVGTGATVDGVRRALESANSVDAATLKVEATGAAAPGVTSFSLSGNTRATAEEALRDELLRAVRASGDLEPSDPVPQSDFIGEGVANRFREEAIVAVLLSILIQIVYLRFRFRDFTYGFAAAIIVAHNVLITLGILSVADALGLAHVKINLPVIASFLTLVGYSVNDTIVVFDRIRETLGRLHYPTSALVDRAIAETLARSIRTSVTVFLVAVTLFATNYGAASSIEGFAFVMVVGVFVSAYASVFISSPLLLFLPVYSRALTRMGRPVVLGLVAALFAGLGVTFTNEGIVGFVGGALACLLPAHFLFHLAGWLRRPDPDAMIREAVEGAAPAGTPAGVAAG